MGLLHPWSHYWVPSLLFFTLSSSGDVTRELVFEIVENVPEGSLIGKITGPLPPYLIVGVDTDLVIDQSNGEIRTKVKLDREVRDSYSFVAIPLNGEGVRVSVHVSDTNDNGPTFPSNVMNVEFPENTPRDVKRTLQPARDKDLGLYNTQRYVISSGNVNNAFRLSSHRERDGVLYLDLQVNGFLDRETTPFYNLVIDAYDGGVPPLKGSMTVHVTLTDDNDNSPIFNQSRYFATISENVTTGTAVLQVFATDTDAGANGVVTYAINRRQTDKDSHFKIDPSTGLISVNRPLDYESKEVHELVVIARDSGIQALETTVFVSIRVLDVNDHQPSISLVFLTKQGAPRITEGARAGEFVARVTVSDPDSKVDYSEANLSLLSGGRGHFELEKKNGGTYLLVGTNAVIDREKFPEYALTLVATHPKIPTLNASLTVRLAVDDVNDNAPVFPDAEFYGSVEEVAGVGTDVIQVLATDSDTGENGAVKYELRPVPGSHSDWFRIDPKTGIISTQAEVDCETESMPSVVVVASDGGSPVLSSSATVYIQIVDVNDNEPVFDQSFYNVSIPEDTPSGRCILKVSATDPDCGINAVVNYTIKEVHSRRGLPWRLNATTGQLCISGSLDYEERNLYEISIIAADAGGLSSTAVVRIQLLDVNDNDPTFYPKFYETTVSEDGGQGTHVVTVKATDPDSMSSLTYEIVRGNEEDHYVIDPQMGVITIKHSLSGSSGRKMELVVSATDPGGRSSEAKVLINVSGPNSHGVQFNQGRYTFRISEDVPLHSTLGSVSASTSAGTGKVRYSISSGDPNEYFKIDGGTGVIKTRNQLDHEKYSTILLNVIATEQNGQGFSHAQVEIQILDSNDNRPEFEVPSLSIWVAESAEVGSIIYSVRANDGDSGEFGRIDYRLLQSPSTVFQLDSKTGDIRLLQALDYEKVKKYRLIIGAADFGVPPKTSNCTLLIEVQDVNDNSPKFRYKGYELTVLESLPLNAHLIEVRADDADIGNNGRITYSLGNKSGTVEGLFGIFPATGILYLKGHLDRETREKYEIMIVAMDHGIPSLSSTTSLMLTVGDENDNDPTFEKSFYTFSIDENNGDGSFVGIVRAGDLDIGDNGAIRYFLQQPFQAQFQIDHISGIITATGSLDREKSSLHELQVVAHDLGHPQRQSEVIVHVTVNDLNDCIPRILEPEEERILVREEQPEGTQVTKIVAVDADGGDNGRVLYALINDEYFSIDQVSGVIRTRTVLKYEFRSSYTLIVVVRDLGLPPLETVQEYRVEVVELDDSIQQTTTRSKFTFEVPEGAAIGHLVGSLRRDDEEEARMTFALIHANTSDGTFELDKRSGKIYVGKALDFEVTSEYGLQVRLTEANGATHLLHVRIEIKDENDERPSFTTDPVTFRLTEDTPIGSPVWNLTAVDLDGGLNGLVHYTITLQVPSTKFRINTLTGTIYVQEQLDYELESTYVLVVTATDQGMDPSKRLSNSVTLHVFIDDINDNSPEFVSPSKISVVSTEGFGALIHTFIAVDADGGVNGDVTFSMSIGVNDEGVFSLDTKSGHLTLKKRIRAEHGATHAFNVTATDGGSPGRSTTQEFLVTVDEMELGPPRFEKRRYTVKVQENALKGTPVVKVVAFTRDRRPNNTVLYILPEASSDGRFGIHPTTGFISLTSSIDRERVEDGELNLTIYAHDSQMMSLYDTTTVTVKLMDLNDNPPRLSCPTLRVPENQELGIIHTFVAEDPDAGRTGEVTFSISHGNPENTFSIDLHGGQLKSRPLDRERRGVYSLTITAQDHGLPLQRASCNLSITVTDENDNSPEFVQREYAVSVSEDARIGTTVVVVEATDADVGLNAVIFYSLNNVSSSHFQIENKTGAIVVAGELDREKIREYSFEVVATDGGLYDSRSSKARIHVTLTDVNDERPQFVTPLVHQVEISAETKPGTRIGQVKATDGDSGLNGEVTYAIENPTSKFRIHPQSGVLTVGENLGAENGRIINLRLIAKDKGKPSMMTMSLMEIVIGNVPISSTLKFTQALYEGKISENSPHGTEILQVTALRNDGRRQKMVYGIISGNEDGGFEVQSGSGQIRVRNSTVLDRERKRNFTILISAQTDSVTSPPLTAHTVVIITLLDENDSSPQFMQDTYVAAVWEGNSKGAFAIQVSASDEDEGANSQLVYYIVDGNEDNAFVIDPPYSGVVKTNIVLDREIQEEYRLTIIATDEGSPQLSGTCLLRINVIDTNDNLPTFPPHSTVSIPEAAGLGSLVTTMVANDVDTHPDLVYNFAPGGNPGGRFSLGKYDGTVWLMKGLDYETEQWHDLSIQVSDSVHEAVTTLRVNVLDSNDHPPRFLKETYEGIVLDNMEVGTEIAQVGAKDLDTPQVNGGIKYSLHVPNSIKSRSAGAKIRIDEETGKVYTNDSFRVSKFEEFVEMTVVATDSGNPPLAVKATLWIHVRPAETQLIKFSAEKYRVEFRQKASPGTHLLKLDVNNDQQRNRDAHFHYSILEGNSNKLFQIGSHTGELSIVKRLPPNSPEEFKLLVSLSCAGMLKCSANTTVVLNVTPSWDSVPFTESASTITVNERKPVGSILFKFEPLKIPPSLTYTLLSGSMSGNPFEVNSETGEVILKEVLDYEKVKEYHLVIGAQVGSSWTLLSLHVLVEDANDNGPHFLLTNYLEFIAENEPVGTPVFTARAIDPDGIMYGNLTHSILETSAAQKFLIDPSTGIVRTATIFDYETLNRFHFTLRAVDGGGLSTTVKVQVDVLSRDEYTPVFRQKSYRWAIPSNAEPGYVVGSVRATDEDQGIDGSVLYTITSQNGHFRINRTTGAVSLRESLRSDLNTSLIITASSGQLGSRSASVGAQILIGPPSASLGSKSSGISDWLIGLLATALLLVFVIFTIVLILYLRRQKKRKRENPKRKVDLSYNGGRNFDTLQYTAHSTMLAGASSRPTSIYSPQYSDLAELGRRRNPGSEVSDKSQNSASSGRGSAEEEEDEEIRMINEGRLREAKLRESLGMLPDSGMQEEEDEDSVKNTQEYLARLGIRPMEDEDSQNGNPEASCPEIPIDISLIYSQIPDEDECDRKVLRRHDGSLNSIIHNQPAEELGGNYSWDYLQQWGPQYQPLAHVFSEIARLNEDVASGHYSGVLGDLGQTHRMGSSCNNSTSGKSDTSATRPPSSSRSSAHRRALTAKSQMLPTSKLPVRGPLPPVPILPRSPITADPSFTSPLSPSFSPELSFCSSPGGLPEHSVGIRTTMYPHPSYSSSESSEMRILPH